MDTRPHILLFNPDQFRGDALGHMGNAQTQTPNLDAHSATEAISFRQAHCQNPVCTPSRCSFMTGWYPHVRGHRTMTHMLQPDEPCLLKVLKDSGYHVVWAGKNDLLPGEKDLGAYVDVRVKGGPSPEKNLHGLKDWRGPKGGPNYYSFLAGRLTPSAGRAEYDDGDWSMAHGVVNFIQNYSGDKPLLIYMPLSYPHPPYGVEEPFYSRIARNGSWPRRPDLGGTVGKAAILHGIKEKQNLGHFDEARWQELRATYLGMCARIDHQFGMVRQALIEKDFWENTGSFVFSDHGDFTGDYGLVEKTQNTFEDCLTRVPFLFKAPASHPVTPGIREGLVELVDLAPTVYELAGVQPGYDHFGQSLIPALQVKSFGRDAVFCEGGRRTGETQAKELTSVASYADISESLYWPRLQWQHGEGTHHGKAVMCRTATHKYVRRLYEKDELYDLVADPHETRNLAGDPAQGSVLAALKDRLLRFYQETADVVPHRENKR